jgi:hypothetical protein
VPLQEELLALFRQLGERRLVFRAPVLRDLIASRCGCYLCSGWISWRLLDFNFWFRGWIEGLDCFTRLGTLRFGHPTPAFIARSVVLSKGFFGSPFDRALARALGRGLGGLGLGTFFEIVVGLLSYIAEARRRSVLRIFACHLGLS